MPSGNYVEGSDAGMPADNAELSSRDQWLKQLKGGLQPVNGSSSHRILLGQVLKSDLLVGQPILYKAPSKKSADLTGKDDSSSGSENNQVEGMSASMADVCIALQTRQMRRLWHYRGDDSITTCAHAVCIFRFRNLFL